MDMQVFPGDQFWIDLGIAVSEWQANSSQIALIGDWNSEASEVDIWMTDHGLINSICELHRYDEVPITYQRSKY